MNRLFVAGLILGFAFLSGCGSFSAQSDIDLTDNHSSSAYLSIRNEIVQTPSSSGTQSIASNTKAAVTCIKENPLQYTCENTEGISRQQVTEKICDMIMRDMMKPAENRTFTITDYRNLTIQSYSKTELSAMNLEETPLAGLADKLTDDQWIALCTVEFRYEGTYSPIGDNEDLPDDFWASDWFGMFGVLFEQEGDVFWARFYPADK